MRCPKSAASPVDPKIPAHEIGRSHRHRKQWRNRVQRIKKSPRNRAQRSVPANRNDCLHRRQFIAVYGGQIENDGALNISGFKRFADPLRRRPPLSLAGDRVGDDGR